MIRAVLWDVDGTLAETERDGHRVAFNRAFDEHALGWQWEVADYGERLAITGGAERLHAAFDRLGHAAGPERDALVRSLHAAKNRHYAGLAGRIALRPGVRALMDDCRSHGVAMAIATTTSRDNVAALLASHLGPQWEQWFGAVVCGEDVRRKKPDPEVFAIALDRLQLPAADCVAIEDSPAGVAAARAAGVPVVVTRSVYFAAGDVHGAAAVGPGLDSRDGWTPPCGSGDGGIGLHDLARWVVSR